jgi:hypothetical protein
MKKRAAAIILAAAAGLGLGLMAPQGAQAATTYSYIATPQGGTVNYGGSTTYNLYLQEVASTGSFQATQDGGVGAAGVSLVETSGSGVTFVSAAGNVGVEPAGFSGGGGGALFTNKSGAYVQDQAGNKFTGDPNNIGISPATTSTDANGTITNLYLLGSVTLSLASDASANFTVESFYDSPTGQGVPNAGTSDLNTVTAATVSAAGYDLDGNHNTTLPNPPGEAPTDMADANPTTFAIGAVSTPEPASMAVFALGAVGLLARRRRTA